MGRLPGEGIAVVVALCVSDLIEKRGTRQDVTSLPRVSSESDVTTGVVLTGYGPRAVKTANENETRSAITCSMSEQTAHAKNSPRGAQELQLRLLAIPQKLKTTNQPPSKEKPLKYISTHEQIADLLTKSLATPQHEKLTAALTGI